MDQELVSPILLWTQAGLKKELAVVVMTLAIRLLFVSVAAMSAAVVAASMIARETAIRSIKLVFVSGVWCCDHKRQQQRIPLSFRLP